MGDIVEYVADFETTVYDGQDRTDVWAWAMVDLTSPDDPDYVDVGTSIQSWFTCMKKKLIRTNIKCYFHNLKFDGSFILDHLLHSDYWQQYGDDDHLYADTRRMPSGSYSYSISDKGLWYSITLSYRGHYCQIVDSLKLLPFSVRKIGKDFALKHKKLEMEYEGMRQPGGELTPEEEAYIKNDVLVVKEALNFMHSEGHDSLTIGACCLKEFKHYYTREAWEELFPDLYDSSRYICTIDDYTTPGDYIRGSYKGGWCYLVPEKASRELHHGTTADVNSLYPSMMHSDSGNRYPVGRPTFWVGDIPDEALQDNRYYFLRVKTRFYIKKDHLPCIQIKTDPVHYHPREWLSTSDYTVKRTGELVKAPVILTLTMTDWELIQDHYDLVDTEVLDGCYFTSTIGLFDEYIDKYAEIKMRSTGARRQLAKLFLNNLYGKFASSTDSSYKLCWLNDDGALRMSSVEEHDKTPGYIPIGSAITSYARRFTIRAAQLNYHGPRQPGFCYADTDSIHCDIEPDDIVGAPEDPVRFNHWKYESCWDNARFVRQKTYVEHITHNDRNPIDPYYDLKCAGMPDHAKGLFIRSITRDIDDDYLSTLDEVEREWIETPRTWEDFGVGLIVPGVLKARHIPGGTLLCKGTYIMHPRL